MYFRPYRRAFASLGAPAPGNLPSIRKKKRQIPGGQPGRGGGGRAQLELTDAKFRLLISSQCVQRSPGSVGWPQGLALPCACMWALVAIIAVVFCADLCESLPWTDHCFGHHIGSLLTQFRFVDHCFGAYLPNSARSPSHPS